MLASNVGLFKEPTGITMLNMNPIALQSEDKYSNKEVRAFGEFCHPVTVLNSSIGYWKKLGFEVKTQMTQPYPWAILSDGLMLIGLHQTKVQAAKATFSNSECGGCTNCRNQW